MSDMEFIASKMEAFYEIKKQSILEHLNCICEKKNYADIVRNDWEHQDEPLMKCLESPEAIDHLLKSWQAKSPDLTREMVKKRVDQHIAMRFRDYRDLPNKKAISKILNDFPDDVIWEVCKVIKPHNFELLWSDSGRISKKLELARQTYKELNIFREKMGSTIKKYENSEHLPLVVVQPMREAYALATAYRDLLAEEIKKSRYKADGTEYKNLTRRHEWDVIMVKIYEILAEQIQLKGKLQHGDETRITRLITELLAAEYPWCWGKDKVPTAEKIVKDRIYRFTTGNTYQ